MAPSPANTSIKTLIVILSLAAMPAVSFAQTTGAATGSSGSTGGVANSPAPPPGTNSLGTAQSSGASRGDTTGAATSGSADAAVNAENELLDKKMKGICRGC
ncbi:hypothetical protein JEY40_27890 [Bradyrhizobium japonicum]|uniref:hypothetical protein n=1 Tax=Bradyrhizobium japonicum TaxID=375 RepID=UPI00200D7E81|nr:hypothetical protein [Bradyrhizobium japonicum]UQD69802.1 hypothetical protein JEY40_27890 [Bradyrhizobium japonicum]